MIWRKEYLHQLAQWKDEQVIKVVTGIRRCGKSTLLMQYQDDLMASGIDAKQIVAINFEDLEYEELCDYKNCIHILRKDCRKIKSPTFFLTKYRKYRGLKRS